jgi:large-conductance mechanosensitive channel
VFVISLWFAIANLLFHIKKLDIIVRTLLHFLAYTIGFYVVMHFIIEHNESAASAFVFTVVFVILYAIIAVSVFLVAHLINRKKNEEEDYTPAFDKKKKQEKKDNNNQSK